MGFFSMLGHGLLSMGRGIIKEGSKIQNDLAPYGMSSTIDLKSCHDVRKLKQIKKTSKSSYVRVSCARQLKELSK